VIRDGYWGSYLFYGPPGGGKTDLLTSAFWDVRARREVARGKWITFGREGNPFLHVPESCRTTSGGMSLRFTVPNLDNTTWLDRFDKFTTVLLEQAHREHPLDVLGIDGLSEFDMLYERTFGGGDGDANKFAKWNGLMDKFFAIMQRLDPNELGCHVIMTARVRERKRGTEEEEKARRKSDFESVSADDPFDYYPSIRGGFKDWLAHYFENVFYIHTRKPPKGKTLDDPQHVVQLITLGDYVTKLQGEREWLAAGYPRELANTNFYAIQHRLENLLGLPHILPMEVQDASVVPASIQPGA